LSSSSGDGDSNEDNYDVEDTGGKLPEKNRMAETIRRDIKSAFSQQGSDLLQLVPELSSIVCASSECPPGTGGCEEQKDSSNKAPFTDARFVPTTSASGTDVSSADEAKRLERLFRTLFEAVCRPDFPVIMFIDDVQWADSSSLQLIRSLVSAKIRNFLLVCSYRGDDADESNVDDGSIDLPIKEMILPVGVHGVDFDDGNQNVHDIRLANLSLADVGALLSDLLNEASVEPDRVDAILKRTGGNPFFVMKYLQLLQREGELYFSFEENKWHWVESCSSSCDEGSIGFVSDSDVLSAHVSSIPSSFSFVLSVASCLGFSFDASILSNILSRGAESDSQFRELLTALDGEDKGTTATQSTVEESTFGNSNSSMTPILVLHPMGRHPKIARNAYSLDD